ncbi:hypothetical protein TNCV_69491 [Trichonephila clavipes]|nr:hypothetical protein TNCV_69491 [Trichonephila clavipes]
MAVRRVFVIKVQLYMWQCDICINQYLSSRDDDHSGVIAKVLAYGTKGRSSDRIFLPSFVTLDMQREPRPSRSAVVAPSIPLKNNQAVRHMTLLNRHTTRPSQKNDAILKPSRTNDATHKVTQLLSRSPRI